MIIVATVIVYFCVLLIFSKLTSRGATNDAFYRANRRAPWYMVAFGMVGASMSGISFIGVPGMVIDNDMTYIQTCLGFVVGYFVVAFALLPIYYKLSLTTIYTYLSDRLGRRSYKTGASFFLLSKMTITSVRFYVVCAILQRFVFDGVGVPFPLTVICLVALIWLYTRKGGTKTLVFTDSFQTLCMFAALILIIYNVMGVLGVNIPKAIGIIAKDPHSRMFVFDDWLSGQNFWKQFLSGIFIVIVMTGLDQDMMQKNLSCKSLREARKDMCSYGFAFIPANLLFMCLGVLLMTLARRQDITLPLVGDSLLPMFAATGRLGLTVIVLFTIGIVAASFSSADSALTSLTTSYCVDIRGKEDDERLRKRAHIGIALVFILLILLCATVNSNSVIDTIYTLCSYTYGPLLGMFAFGLLTKRAVNDKVMPYIAVASPIVCFMVDYLTTTFTGYKFGYELLMLNGLLTFIGMWVVPRAQR